MVEFYLQYILIALLFAECTAGIIVNVFIVATNFWSWRTLKTLQTCEKILSCLATSRCLLLFHAMSFIILSEYFSHLFQSLVLSLSMTVGTIFLNYTTFWFTTILCVFYCVKITNYNHKLFTFLKTRISSLVHWLIMASLIISVGCSLPCGLAFYYRLKDITQGSGENVTITNVMVLSMRKYWYMTILMGFLPPFLIFCVAIFLLIESLWRHIRHMRGGGVGLRSPNLEVHFGTVKNMSLFLVLNVVYLAGMNLLLFSPHNMSSTWIWLVSIITGIPPFLHSLYIIFSNKKLSETFLRWFCCH